jgi:hypothetical protein
MVELEKPWIAMIDHDGLTMTGMPGILHRQFFWNMGFVGWDCIIPPGRIAASISAMRC